MPSPSDPKFRIVILGDGVAGAMAAAFLARAVPRETHEIHLLTVGGEDDSLGAFGPVEASTPSSRLFLSEFGLSEDDLVRRGDAAYSLGVAFSGWSNSAATYFLPYGDQGAPLSGVAFHQLAARLRVAGRSVRLGDYSAASLMAQAGRFMRPSNDPASPLSTYSFGFQISRSRYAALLRNLAIAGGAFSSPSIIDRVEEGADGVLGAAVLENGERVAGDLFIDASGPAAIGMSALGGSHFESWQPYLPCDSSVELAVPTPVPPSPYSHVAALPIGWRRTVPSNGERGEAVIYSSTVADRTAAEAALLDGIGAASSDAEVIHSSFAAGRRTDAWVGNCVAIGAAACLLEPLASQSLMLVENSLRRLLRLFPSHQASPIEAHEYNRETRQELDRTRDFVAARYALNGRLGEPFWDAARNAARPATLEEKLSLYRSRGRIPLMDGDLFDEGEWTAVLDEHGVQSERYDVRADGIAPERLDQFLARMRQAIIASIAPLPSHGDYLAALRTRSAA